MNFRRIDATDGTPYMWTLKQAPVCAIVSRTHARKIALKRTMSRESATRLVLSGSQDVHRVSRWLNRVAAPARNECGLPGAASFAMAVTRSAPRELSMNKASAESFLHIHRRGTACH